jgi:hypothetical protein
MGNQRWLDDFRRQLIGRKLPGKYVQRIVEEAADHLEDLMEESMKNTDLDLNARMGDSEHVAESAVAAFRCRSFLGRHPAAAFMTFAVSPLVAFLVLMFAVLIAFFGTCKLCGLIDNDGLHLGALKAVINYALPLAVISVPSMLLSFLYCSLSRKTVVGKKWMLFACGALVVVSSATFCELHFNGASDHGQLILFVGARYWIQIVQFLIAVAFSWWLIRRSDQGRTQLAA